MKLTATVIALAIFLAQLAVAVPIPGEPDSATGQASLVARKFCLTGCFRPSTSKTAPPRRPSGPPVTETYRQFDPSRGEVLRDGQPLDTTRSFGSWNGYDNFAHANGLPPARAGAVQGQRQRPAMPPQRQESMYMSGPLNPDHSQVFTRPH